MTSELLYDHLRSQDEIWQKNCRKLTKMVSVESLSLRNSPIILVTLANTVLRCLSMFNCVAKIKLKFVIWEPVCFMHVILKQSSEWHVFFCFAKKDNFMSLFRWVWVQANFPLRNPITIISSLHLGYFRRCLCHGKLKEEKYHLKIFLGLTISHLIGIVGFDYLPRRGGNLKT